MLSWPQAIKAMPKACPVAYKTQPHGAPTARCKSSPFAQVRTRRLRKAGPCHSALTESDLENENKSVGSESAHPSA